MKYRKVVVLLGFMWILLLLHGCSKDGYSIETGNKTIMGREDYLINVSPDSNPDPYNSFFSDEYLFYWDVPVEKNEIDTPVWNLYRTNLSDNSTPTLILQVSNRYPMKAYAFQNGTECTFFVLFLCYENSSLYIDEYDINGGFLSSAEISDASLKGVIPIDFSVDSDSFYIVSEKNIYAIAKNGDNIKKYTKYNGKFGQAALTDDGCLYVIYTLGDSNFLYIFGGNHSLEPNEIKLPFHPYGIFSRASEILIECADGIILFNRPDKVFKQIFDYSDYKISTEKTISIKGYSHGFLMLLSSSRSDAGFVISRFDESIDFTEPKEVLHVYFPANEFKYTNMPSVFDDFNDENGRYYIEPLLNDKPVDKIYYSETPPDLIFSESPNIIDNYIRLGYLQSLNQYMDESDFLHWDDVCESLRRAFGRENNLYAVPAVMKVRTLLVTSDNHEWAKGWTPSEYLEWINAHPLAYSSGGISLEHVFSNCLLGSMADYVDFEKGVSSFDSERFCELLRQIREANYPVKNTSLISVQLYPAVATNKKMDYLMESYISYACEISLARAASKHSLDFVGFPNNTSQTMAYMYPTSNIGIFSESLNKEGAFEFIEYYLDWTYRHWSEIDNTYLWILKSEREQTYKDSCEIVSKNYYEGDERKKVSYSIDQSDIDLLLSIEDEAILYSYEIDTIINIVKEESAAFFEGQKTAEDVCKIIDSRVSLFLQERNN